MNALRLRCPVCGGRAAGPPLQRPSRLLCAVATSLAPAAQQQKQQQKQQHHHQQQQQHLHQHQQHKQQPLPQQPRQDQLPTEWRGLEQWRSTGIDARRTWGPANKAVQGHEAATEQLPLPRSLVGVALQVLATADADAKAALSHRGWKAYCDGRIPLHEPGSSGGSSNSRSSSSSAGGGQQPQQHQRPPDRPARPAKPELVVPKHVVSPKDSPLPLSVHMLHNLAHIELNAVDLAWDSVARFSHLMLPQQFYEDFARVADDESRHFAWCQQRLRELGFAYGDLPAHDLLWQGAEASAGDLGARLAIVPLSQEARGLDAGQRLVKRLVGAGDKRSASIVDAIAREERAHVAVGVVWFGRLCSALGVDPPSCFRAWLAELGPELLKGPFNHDERQEVGLPRAWYDVEMWPQELQEQLVQPAVAAAARGHGLAAAAAAPKGAAPAVVPRGGRELEQLRQRLWAMLQGEARACGLASE